MLHIVCCSLHQLEIGNLCRYKNLYISPRVWEKQKSEEIEGESENLSCLYCIEAFPSALCGVGLFSTFSSVWGKEVGEVTTLS